MGIARAKRPVTPSDVVEKLLAWHVFWAIGVSYLYNFVMHGFFGKMSAAFIGWADSPFQFEVATASLGFSVVGFHCGVSKLDLRLAAIVGPSLFMLGAAAGHLYQMVTEHNFAPGNAGVVFYMDIVIPLFGLLLLWLQHRYGRPRRQPGIDSEIKSAAPMTTGSFPLSSVPSSRKGGYALSGDRKKRWQRSRITPMAFPG